MGMASHPPKAPSSATFRMVSLEEVDSEDRSLALSRPWQLSSGLLESIDRHGILTPLGLRRPPSGLLQIIHGFRRFEAARRLGLPSVPGLICESQDLLDLFLQALEENRTARRLSRLEKAAALRTLKYRFNVPEKRLVEAFLPLLDLQPEGRLLGIHLELADLPDALQQALDGGLEVETALKLARRDEEFRRLCCRVIVGYQLGRNRQKEFVEMLDEIVASTSGRASAVQVWKELGAAEIEAQAGLSPADRRKRILAQLRQARYPSLARHQARFDQLKATLKLPPQVRLQAPRHFEGSSLEIAMTIREAGQLPKLARELERISASREWEELFGLL